MNNISGDIARALSLTFLHSLWQAGLFGLAGLILISIKQFKAATRYFILVFLLFGFFIVNAITFIIQVPGTNNTPVPSEVHLQNVPVAQSIVNSYSFIDRLTSF